MISKFSKWSLLRWLPRFLILRIPSENIHYTPLEFLEIIKYFPIHKLSTDGFSIGLCLIFRKLPQLYIDLAISRGISYYQFNMMYGFKTGHLTNSHDEMEFLARYVNVTPEEIFYYYLMCEYDNIFQYYCYNRNITPEKIKQLSDLTGEQYVHDEEKYKKNHYAYYEHFRLKEKNISVTCEL